MFGYRCNFYSYVNLILRIIKLLVLNWALEGTSASAMEVKLMARRLTSTRVIPVCLVQYSINEPEEGQASLAPSQFITPVTFPCAQGLNTVQEAYQGNSQCIEQAVLEPMARLLPLMPQHLSMAMSITYIRSSNGGAPEILLIDRDTTVRLPQITNEYVNRGESQEYASPNPHMCQPIDLISALYRYLTHPMSPQQLCFKRNQPVYMPFYAAAITHEVQHINLINNHPDKTFEITLLSHTSNISGYGSQKIIHVIVKFITTANGFELQYVGIPAMRIDFISAGQHCPGRSPAQATCFNSADYKPPPAPPPSPVLKSPSSPIEERKLNQLHLDSLLESDYKGSILHGGFGK